MKGDFMKLFTPVLDPPSIIDGEFNNGLFRGSFILRKDTNPEMFIRTVRFDEFKEIISSQIEWEIDDFDSFVMLFQNGIHNIRINSDKIPARWNLSELRSHVGNIFLRDHNKLLKAAILCGLLD
jgi:hypothetical protein